jgi:hypothetical protein
MTRIIALLLLASCTTPDRNRFLVVEQCSPNFAFETVEILRDGEPGAETILDMAKSECFCRRYKYSLAFMGPIAGSTVTHRIEKCDRLVGNPPDDYARTVKFLGDVRQDLQDNAKR